MREPNNFYDSNAIKVFNLQGEPIGHLKREQAEALAPLIDEEDVTVEGMIPRGSGNVYTIPVQVSLFGRPNKLEHIQRVLWTEGLDLDQTSPRGPKPSTSSGVVLQNEIDESLKRLLFQQVNGDFMVACDAIGSTLYPYQMAALKWMMDHENGDYVPPFWTKVQANPVAEHQIVYLNTLNGARLNSPPPSPHGGILADDMGLGKTLTMIALIFTNFHDKKPLAKPDPFYIRDLERQRSVAKFLKQAKAMGPEVSQLDEELDASSVGTQVTQSSGSLDLAKAMNLSIDHDRSDRDFNSNIEGRSSEIEQISDEPFEATPSCSKDFPNQEIAHSETSHNRDDVGDQLSDSTSWNSLTPPHVVSQHLRGTETEPNVKDLSVDANVQKQVNCICKQGNHWGFLVPCATCGVYLHGRCIQINKRKFSDMAGYNCQSCRSIDPKLEAVIKIQSENDPQVSTSANSTEPLIKIARKEEPSVGLPLEPEIQESYHLSQDHNYSAVAEFHSPILKDSLSEKCENELSQENFGEVGANVTIDNLDTSSESSKLDLGKQVEESPEKKTKLNDRGTGELTKRKTIIPPKETGCAKGRPRPTLIICPMGLISHWITQLDSHVRPSIPIKLFVDYGTTRAKDAQELKEQDIVITTYGTLASHSSNESPVFAIEWLRVILDEGHIVKNIKTRTAKAVLRLKCDRKWIITGTPIQNNLEELYPLIEWLDVTPLSRGKSFFQSLIISPIQYNKPEGISRLQSLLSTICIRRQKTDLFDGKPLVELPAKNILVRQVLFNDEEQRQYESLKEKGLMLLRFMCLEEGGNLLKRYAHIFALVVRLRQFCCHPQLLPIAIWNDLHGIISEQNQSGFGEALNSLQQDKLKELWKGIMSESMDEECVICMESLVTKTPMVTQCKHVFCRACIINMLEGKEHEKCPLCRALISKSTITEIREEEDDAGAAQGKISAEPALESSKLTAVCQELDRIKTSCPNDKIVVVSQFAKFLNVVEPILKTKEFCYVRYDGTMSSIKRAKVLNTFNEGSAKVLLLSMKAGGVGLNLVAANHLLYLDPAWNPALEEQCFNRVHRLGQVKEVFIYKFIVQNSIEERIVHLQDKKKALVARAFGVGKSNQTESRKERLQDLQELVGFYN